MPNNDTIPTIDNMTKEPILLTLFRERYDHVEQTPEGCWETFCPCHSSEVKLYLRPTSRGLGVYCMASPPCTRTRILSDLCSLPLKRSLLPLSAIDYPVGPPRERDGTYNLVCQQCKGKFKSRRAHAKFCSNACTKVASRQRLKSVTADNAKLMSQILGNASQEIA